MKTHIKQAQRAAGTAACIAAALAAGKFGFYFFSGSLIVALSALDSSIDMLISSINRMIIKFSRKSSDENHPYGHGKAESITALGQGALITGGALMILGSSSKSLYAIFHGAFENNPSSWTIVLFFLLAAFLSWGVSYWLKRFGNQFNSPALAADALHYRGDMVSNLGSAISLFAIMLTDTAWLDPLIAGLFSFYIGWNGLLLMRTSINELMDHEVPEGVKRKAIGLIAGVNDKILDVHNFRSRSSGHAYFFDFHVTLPRELPFEEVHEIVRCIEHVLLETFHTDAVVRADPDGAPEQVGRTVVFSRTS